MRRTVAALCVWLAWAGLARADEPGWLEKENGHVEDGNRLLRSGDPKGALKAYDEAARELPSHGGVHLNRGLALMASKDRAAARQALSLATSPPGDPGVRADAHYDLGVSFYREADELAGQEDHETAQQRFREAADSFKQALRLRPGDRNAAWNLELSLRRIREQEQKQQEKEQQEQDQQEQQDPQQQDQQQQDQQQQDQQQQDQQQQDQQPQDQQPQDQQPQDQRQPQDAQQEQVPAEVGRALDALQDGEQNLEKLKAQQRANRERRRVEKDW